MIRCTILYDKILYETIMKYYTIRYYTTRYDMMYNIRYDDTLLPVYTGQLSTHRLNTHHTLTDKQKQSGSCDPVYMFTWYHLRVSACSPSSSFWPDPDPDPDPLKASIPTPALSLQGSGWEVRDSPEPPFSSRSHRGTAAASGAPVHQNKPNKTSRRIAPWLWSRGFHILR